MQVKTLVSAATAAVAAVTLWSGVPRAARQARKDINQIRRYYTWGISLGDENEKPAPPVPACVDRLGASHDAGDVGGVQAVPSAVPSVDGRR